MIFWREVHWDVPLGVVAAIWGFGALASFGAFLVARYTSSEVVLNFAWAWACFALISSLILAVGFGLSEIHVHFGWIKPASSIGALVGGILLTIPIAHILQRRLIFPLAIWFQGLADVKADSQRRSAGSHAQIILASRSFGTASQKSTPDVLRDLRRYRKSFWLPIADPNSRVTQKSLDWLIQSAPHQEPQSSGSMPVADVDAIWARDVIETLTNTSSSAATRTTAKAVPPPGWEQRPVADDEPRDK